MRASRRCDALRVRNVASATGCATASAAGPPTRGARAPRFPARPPTPRVPGCLDSLESHKNVDPKLIASYTTTGGEAKYSITTTNENPSEGIPGLIEYCVYTSPLPDETEATYSNANGAWTSGSGGGFFDFGRSDGNPDNLPFDGTTQSVGNATWNSGTVPSNQVILLHINDEAECTALEGTPTETCFVRPEVCHTLVGVGHFGPRGPTGTNLDNNMSTCPQKKQQFEMSWENRAYHMHMSKLTSSSYAKNGTETDVQWYRYSQGQLNLGLPDQIHVHAQERAMVPVCSD